MALQSFLFGGDTKETPESIKRKRDIARALLGAQGAPRNVGEGLNALGDGIVSAVLNSRADKAEKTGMESAANDFSPLIGGFGVSPATPGATGSSMPKVDAGGNIPVATAPDDVKNLIAANVPPELQAYATNLIGKESSFDPNAVSPTGATGLAQFTRGTGKQYGLVSDQGDMRKDPVANLKALVALTNDNRAGLTQALGRAPTDGELALAHQQGLQGAVNLLSGKSVPGNNLAVNNVDPNSDPRAAAKKIMAFYGGSGGQEVASLDPSAGMDSASPIEPPPVNAPAPPPTPGYVDPAISTERRAPAPLPVPAQAPQPSPAVAQALMAPQKGGRLGTPPQPLPDAEFNARFGSDDTGAIPPQIGPQSALPPLPVTEVGPTPNVASVPPMADAPQQPNQEVAQALLRQDRSGVGIGGDAPGAGYFPAAPNVQGQGPSQEQLLRVLTNEYSSPSQRAVANALLQRQMDANDPDAALDREYKRAQIGALTGKQAGYTVLSPAERKALGIPDTDQRVYQKGPNGQIDAVGGVGQTINIGNEVDQRRAAAERAGLKPEDPGYQGFILTGKMPKENEQPLTTTDKKAILEADDAISTNKSAIGLLDQAMAINKKANSGWLAGTRAVLGNNLPDIAVPDLLSSPESSAATTEYDNLVQQGALSQLKTIFGGNPTEGERSILLDLQASSNKPPAIREKILQRAKALAEARLTLNQQRSDQLRGGEFYKPQGGMSNGDSTKQGGPQRFRFNPVTGELE